MPANLSKLASSALRFTATKSHLCAKRKDEVMSWILYNLRIKIPWEGEGTPELLVFLMEERSSYLIYN